MSRRTKEKPADGRDPVLDAILADLGDVTVMDDALFAAEPKSWISTGIPLLDMSLRGVKYADGGLGIGRCAEIVGDSDTGKTILILGILQANIAKGGISGLMDAEDASTRDFAKEIAHVNTARLSHIPVESIDHAGEQMERFIEKARKHDKQRPIVLGWDSIIGRFTREEEEKGIADEGRRGARARVIRRILSKIMKQLAAENVALIWTNHLMAKMDPYDPGVPSGGGTAPKFFASVRIQVSAKKAIKAQGPTGPEQIGRFVQARPFKNRYGPAFRAIEYPIYSRNHTPVGVDNVQALIEYLYKTGALGSDAGWVTWDGQRRRPRELAALVQQDDGLRIAMEQRAAEIMDGGITEEAALNTKPADEDGSETEVD